MLVSGILAASSFTQILDKAVKQPSLLNLSSSEGNGNIYFLTFSDVQPTESDSSFNSKRFLISLAPFALFLLGYAMVHFSEKFTPKYIEKT